MARLLILTIVLSLWLACDDDPMRRARQAHAAENADAAEAAFNEVLASDPQNFEARRLMADVHRFRKDFEKAEKELNALWTEKKFDGKGELSTEDSVTKRHMTEQFDRLYLAWVETIDKSKKPELFESVAGKGLERTPKSPTLNRELVDFYFEQGDKLYDEGKKLEAADSYEKVYNLIALPKRRTDAQARAKKIRSEVFAENFQKKFEAETLPKLKEESRWEPAKKGVVFSAEVPVDRKLNPKKPDDAAEAKKIALAVFETEISEFITFIGGIETKMPRAGLPKYTLSEDSFKRGKYKLSASIPLDAMMSAGFEFQQFLLRQTKKAKKNPAEKPEKKEEPAEKPEETKE